MQVTMAFKIHCDRDYKGELQYHAFSSDMSAYGYIYVCDRTITIDLPDGFDVRAAEIDMLRKKADDIQSRAQVKVNMIQEQISKLLCLEHKPDLCDERR